jgi:hypothetical protein
MKGPYVRNWNAHVHWAPTYYRKLILSTNKIRPSGASEVYIHPYIHPSIHPSIHTERQKEYENAIISTHGSENTEIRRNF